MSNFAAWFSGLLGTTPAAYSVVYDYLKRVMRDLKDIQNPSTGPDSHRLVVQFENEKKESLKVQLEDISDGEKCYLICALVIAAKKADEPLVCFWDEPDNFLALSEIGHFVLSLRSAFQSGGQFIATSHNPEAIERFSRENTFVLERKSHLDPTIVRPLTKIRVNGDLVGALVRGDVLR